MKERHLLRAVLLFAVLSLLTMIKPLPAYAFYSGVTAVAQNSLTIAVSSEKVINYNLNGGTNAASNPQTYTPGTTLTLAAPTKAECVFGGWYTDAAFRKKVTDSPEVSGESLDLYAKWTQNGDTLSRKLFRDFLTSQSPSEIIFLNTGVENTSGKTNVSEDPNGNVWAWKEGSIVYVANQDANRSIKAPADSSNLFESTDSSNSSSKGTRSTWHINAAYLDTSNVTAMNSMFGNFGRYLATNIKIEGLSTWDTSNVTTMAWMFCGTGYDKATNVSIEGLENWNTSKVEYMQGMFYGIVHADTSKTSGSIDLDLSGWDTSNVKNVGGMFQYFFEYADSVTLNLDGWDLSNVTNVDSVFLCSGAHMSDKSKFVVYISKTNPGNSNTNTETRLYYGKGSSYIAPPYMFTYSHHLELTATVPATCTAEGSETWTCYGGAECKARAHSTPYVTTITSAKTAHQWDSNYVCTVCGTNLLSTLNYKDNVITGSGKVSTAVSSSDYDYHNDSMRPYYSQIITIIPSASGSATFQGSCSRDTYGTLYDANMNMLTYNDDDGGSSQFKVTYTVTAGQVYYLAVGMYSVSDSGTITTTITLPGASTSGLTLNANGGSVLGSSQVQVSN